MADATSTIMVDVAPQVWEISRRERHHEIVCIALQALIETSNGMTRPSLSSLADEARSAADRLYPPPKDPRP